ncbi:MAG: type II toxin-antitoxin system VapC family toxin [Verrucomicrobiota bacterium]
MITALDTSVLLTLFKEEPGFEGWLRVLEDAVEQGNVVFCPVVLAEFSQHFASLDDCLSACAKLGASSDSISDDAAFLAGQIFKQYRRNKGPRKTLIPDFLIAAHAQVQADRIAAIDRGFLRSYFPDLEVVTP